MPNSNCGRNAWSNMVKGLERWRLGASRPRSMPDQLWGTADLSQWCAARQSGGHTEAYGEAASPALTIRFGNNRAQSRPGGHGLGPREGASGLGPWSEPEALGLGPRKGTK